MTGQEKIIPDPPEITDIQAAKALFEHCMARAVHYPTLRPAYISAAVNAVMTLIPLELDYDRSPSMTKTTWKTLNETPGTKS